MTTVSRLLDQFIPHHYTLTLSIDRKARNFSGVVVIIGESTAGSLVVHAHELAIDSVQVDGQAAMFELGIDDQVTITYPNASPGAHTLTIAYHGSINDSLHGLYPSYFTHEGIQKELLITQFESHYAREMFPCIDEPAAKATFDVTVETETGITVLGNMPIKQQHEAKGRLITTFDTTPRMSTYLLALVMGELQSKTATTASGVDVAVWATPAQSPASLDFALEEAVKTIEFFDEYFSVPYPLPKADHVAVPDFSAGAMENWGLITYRETALIVDKTNSSLAARQYVASVIAHELSHQWFGNLVTMKWWNNLWLNESFASIMENIAPDALHPEWNVWLDFDTGSAVAALRRDSIDGVQSVQIVVNHPDEIQSLFDGAIVYAKGARLIRMMIEYIGEDAFRAGLKAYFTQFAYQNTEETDLWQCLDTASGKQVSTLMHAWISQPGYPVVSAKLTDGTLTLTQQQFFVGTHHDMGRKWPVPLGAATRGVPLLLDEVPITLAYREKYLQLNHTNSAHFITQYDDTLLSALLEQLTAGHLSTAQRLQLLNEQVLLSRGGRISPASLVDLLDFYRHETQEPVWDTMIMAINELKKYVLSDETAEKKLRTFVGSLARERFDTLGWQSRDGEPDNDRKLRGKVIAQMLYSEEPKVIAEALALYQSKPIETLDPELRALLLSTAVRYGEDSSLLTTLLDRYKVEILPEIKDDIRSAITSVRSASDISLVLSKLTDTSLIRPQDTVHWYIYLLSNRFARDDSWQWLRNNWGWIETTFSSDKSYDYFPRYAGQLLMNRQQLVEYREFFTPMLADIGLRRVIEMGVTDLEGRVELIETHHAAVCERLSQL